MKQTLIQIIVAVVALAALATVVYRAQSTAPPPAADVTSPPVQKITLTNEPIFLPSTKTDAGAGARIKAAPIQPVEADGPAQQAGEQGVEPEAVDITIGDELFLPSTKAGPIIPAREEGGE